MCFATTSMRQPRIDGREILRLVDEEVLEDERLLALPQLAADELVGAHQERVVLRIERGAVVRTERLGVGAEVVLVLRLGLFSRRGLALGAIPGIEIEHRGAAIGAPAPGPLELIGAQLRIRRFGERGLDGVEIGEQLGPEMKHPARVLAGPRIGAEHGRALCHQAQHHRVRLQLGDDRGRALLHRRFEPGERALPGAGHPLAERLHRDAGEPERREDLADVRAERRAADDDQHLVRREAVARVVVEERHAVDADGRLAAAGAALDDDDAGVGPRDEIELPRIEERRDLREMPVLLGGEARAHAERALHVLRADGRALPAGQLGGGDADRLPSLVGADDRALRRGDAAELALVDGDGAPDEHLALDLALAEGLLVLRAFLVAVIDSGSRARAASRRCARPLCRRPASSCR
ncbi:MAG: hypothetical protein QM820_53295 [Minicystis sp.]